MNPNEEKYFLSQAGANIGAVMVALYNNNGFFSISEIVKLSNQSEKVVRAAIDQFMEWGGIEKWVDGDKWGLTLEARQMADEMQARMGKGF